MELWIFLCGIMCRASGKETISFMILLSFLAMYHDKLIHVFIFLTDATQGSSASERTGDDAKIQQSKEAAAKHELGLLSNGLICLFICGILHKVLQ